MTADFGGAAMLALPVPALVSSDAWTAVASEALVVVLAALAVAAALLAVRNRLASHKGEPHVFTSVAKPAGNSPRASPGRESRPAAPRVAEAAGDGTPAPHAG